MWNEKVERQATILSERLGRGFSKIRYTSPAIHLGRVCNDYGLAEVVYSSARRELPWRLRDEDAQAILRELHATFLDTPKHYKNTKREAVSVLAEAILARTKEKLLAKLKEDYAKVPFAS